MARRGIPDGITAADIEAAIEDFVAGEPHRFGKSRKFDVLHKGRRYPPKAIIGLAARRVAGRTLAPRDFTGGQRSKSFRILRENGFRVVEKPDSEPGQTDARQSRQRSPAWTRDELILALDVYFKYPGARGNETHPAIAELSNLLGKLPIHPSSARTPSFRNLAGVSMKLSNFLRLDPGYKGAGMGHGSALEAEVWDEFYERQENLAALAQTIRENGAALPSGDADADDLDDEEEASEGKILTRAHKRRERNRKIVRQKKKQVLKRTGKLACEACNFDFEEGYGDRGYGFAECHHDRPLSELKPGEKTKLKDLRVLCANCHRMIHRGRPWLTVEDIRELLV